MLSAEFRNTLVIKVQETTPLTFYFRAFIKLRPLLVWSMSPESLSLKFPLSSLCPPGMLSVHPTGAAARHRPPAGRSGEGKGGGRRAGGPTVTTAAPLAAP